jgi:hypothetical protein
MVISRRRDDRDSERYFTGNVRSQLLNGFHPEPEHVAFEVKACGYSLRVCGPFEWSLFPSGFGRIGTVI